MPILLRYLIYGLFVLGLIRPGATPPPNDLILTLTLYGDNSIRISWLSISSDADSIGIWYKIGGYPTKAHEGGTSIFHLFTGTPPVTTGNKTIAGFAPGKTFYFSGFIGRANGEWSDTIYTALRTATTNGADHFSIEPDKITQRAGTSFNLSVKVLNDNNQLIGNYDTTGKVYTVTTTAGAAPDGSIPIIEYPVLFSNGIASAKTTLFQAVTSGNITYSINDGSISGTTLDSVIGTVTPADTALYYTNSGGQPVDSLVAVTAGTAFEVYISLLDSFQNLVSGYTNGNITVKSGTMSPIQPAPDGTLPQFPNPIPWTTFISGIANLSVTLFDSTSAVNLKTQNSSGLLEKESPLFEVKPGSAKMIRFTNPSGILLPTLSNQTAGSPFKVYLTALDSFQNIVAGYNQGTITAKNGTSFPAENAPDGTLPQFPGASSWSLFPSGIASFNITLFDSGATVNLKTQNSSGLQDQESPVFMVVSAEAKRVAFTTTNGQEINSIADQTAGQLFSLSVSVLDDYDNRVNSYNAGQVSLGAGTAFPPQNSLLGFFPSYPSTVSWSGQNGTVQFSVTLYDSAFPVTLRVTDSTGLMGEESPSFGVLSHTAERLTFFSQPPVLVFQDNPFPFNPVLRVADLYGNFVSTDQGRTVVLDPVLYQDSLQPGSGTLSNNTALTVNGQAGFTGVIYNAVEKIRLRARSIPELDTVFSVTVQVVDSLVDADLKIVPNSFFPFSLFQRKNNQMFIGITNTNDSLDYNIVTSSGLILRYLKGPSDTVNLDTLFLTEMKMVNKGNPLEHLLFTNIEISDTLNPDQLFFNLALFGNNSQNQSFGKLLELPKINILPPYLDIQSLPVESGSAFAGSSLLRFLTLRFENILPDTQILTTLKITNITKGKGSLGNRDSAFLRLYICKDQNKNIQFDGLATDSSLVSGKFSNGVFTANGVNLKIAPSETLYCFVIADLHPRLIRVGDTLDLQITDSTDLTFQNNPSRINAQFPLNSPGQQVIAGLISSQFSVSPVSTIQLFPKDQGKLLYDIIIPANGYNPDTLDEITIENIETAMAGIDIDSLKVYLAHPDSDFQKGNYQFLGTLKPTSDKTWSKSKLNVPIPAGGKRLFILGDIAPLPRDQFSVRLQIPLYGLQYRSGITGPIEQPLSNPFAQVISIIQNILIRANPLGFKILIPDTQSILLLDLEMTSTYQQDQVLTGAVFYHPPRTRLRPVPAGVMDSAYSVLKLYQDDGDGVFEESQDTELGGGSLRNGRIQFSGLNLRFSQSQNNYRLFMAGFVNPRALSFLDTLSVTALRDSFIFQQVIVLSSETMITSQADWIVDGISSSQIKINSIPEQFFNSGDTGRLVFDFVLPSNGLQSDSMIQLQIRNFRSADQRVLDPLYLWTENFSGDSIGSLVGPLQWNAAEIWEEKTQRIFIPKGGRRFWVKANIRNEGGIVKMGLPEEGVLFSSGNHGPVGSSVENLFSQQIIKPDIISFFPNPLLTGLLSPDSGNFVILSFFAFNGYNLAKTLQRITVQNISRGVAGYDAVRDLHLRNPSLYLDKDNSQTYSAQDDLKAQSLFQGGRVTFSGFDINVPAGGKVTLFVTVDLDPFLSRDGDTVDAEIMGPNSFTFAEDINVGSGETGVVRFGEWPLNSSGEGILNGLVSAQVINHGSPNLLVTAGYQNLPIMDFTLYPNGYQPDTLRFLLIKNSLSTDSGFTSGIHLFADRGTLGWTGIEDSLLGSMTFSSQEKGWQWIGQFELSQSQRFIVTTNIYPQLQTDYSLQMYIPLHGIQKRGSNNGPLDRGIINPESQTISKTGLEVSFGFNREKVNLGQSYGLTLQIKNVGQKDLNDLRFVISDLGVDSLIGFFPKNSQFNFQKTVIAMTIQTGFQESLVITSSDFSSPLQFSTNRLDVQRLPNELQFSGTSLVPKAIQAGEDSLALFSITFKNPQSENTDIILDSVVLMLLNGSQRFQLGDYIQAVRFPEIQQDTQFSLLSSDTLVFKFSGQPVRIAGGGESNVTILIDAEDDFSTGSVLQFSLTHVYAHDANAGQSVPVKQGLPLLTPTTIFRNSDEYITIEKNVRSLQTVSAGQDSVVAFELFFYLVSPDSGLASLSSLTEINFQIQDSGGGTYSASQLFDRLVVQSDEIRYFDGRSDLSFSNFSGSINAEFDLPLVLSSLQKRRIEVVYWLNRLTSSQLPPFQIVVDNIDRIHAFDINKADRKIEILDTMGVFPVMTELIKIQDSVRQAEIIYVPPRSSEAVPGQQGFELGSLKVYNPDLGHIAASIFNGLNLHFTYPQAKGKGASFVTAAEIFDAVYLKTGSDTIGIEKKFSLPDLVVLSAQRRVVVPAKDTIVIQIFGDIEGNVERAGGFDYHFEAQDLFLVDANGGWAVPKVQGFFPFKSPAFKIIENASGIHITSFDSLLPANVISGQKRVPAFRIGLLNAATSITASSVHLTSLVIYFKNRQTVAIDSLRWITPRVYVLAGSDTAVFEVPYSSSGNLMLSLDSTLDINIDNSSKKLEFLLDIAEQSPLRDFKLGLVDSMCLQGREEKTGTLVSARFNNSPVFQILTNQTAINPANLKSSYANYPNPFGANHPETYFIYYLPEKARVTLRIYTLTGELVHVLLNEVIKQTGLYDKDEIWDGRNGRGEKVLNGVYIAMIYANYLQGTRKTEKYLRKVSVIR